MINNCIRKAINLKKNNKRIILPSHLSTVGPGSPEELVPFQSRSIGYVEVPRVEHAEVGELLGQVPRGPLESENISGFFGKIFLSWKNLADLILNIGSRFCSSNVFLSSIAHSAKSSIAFKYPLKFNN